MLLYTYREAADTPLDFCVRKVEYADDPDNQDWPFEFCNVREGGISYRAGVRNGDRVNGHCDYQESTRKKRRNWQDDTLQMLNSLPCKILLIILVDKRRDLELEDENTHMKRRLEFIATKKSNLKNQDRLDELPRFLRKRDRNHRKSSSKRSSTPERNEIPSTPGNDVIRGGSVEGQDAMSEETLSNEGEADSAVTSTRDLNETSGAECGSQSGDDLEFDGDGTYRGRDIQMLYTSTEQNSGDADSCEEEDKFVHVANMTAARTLSAQGGCAEVQKTPVGVSTPLDVAATGGVSGNCNVDELAVLHADTEGRSLIEQGDERPTVESGNWNDDGQRCEDQTCGDGRAPRTTSISISSEADCGEDRSSRSTLTGTKRCCSGGEIQSSSTTKRAKISEAATNAWDVEAASFARQNVLQVVQCSDAQCATASQWQSWFRDQLGRRSEEKILTQLENAISTKISKGKCISEQFGDFAFWIAKQFAPDKPVLPLSDVSFATIEPCIPRDSQDPYEVTKSLKAHIDKIVTGQSQDMKTLQRYSQESEERKLQSALKTSQLQDKEMGLDSILLVLEKARETCQLELEQENEKVARLKEELEDATREYMPDSLFQTSAKDQAAAKCDLLKKHLAQAKRDLDAKEETAEAATYLFSFWAGLRDSLGIARHQHEEYVQRQEASTKSYNDSTQKALQEIDAKLISALEEYFGTSFRAQEYASSRLKPLLQTRTEDKANLGGFLGVDPTDTGVTELQKLEEAAETARKQDLELVELLHKLREDNSAHYRELDRKLTEAHPIMWNKFLEALNKVELSKEDEQVMGSQEERERTSRCDDDVSANDGHSMTSDRYVSEIREDEVAVDRSTPAPHPTYDGDFNFDDKESEAAFVSSSASLNCSERPGVDTTASKANSGCALM